MQPYGIGYIDGEAPKIAWPTDDSERAKIIFILTSTGITYEDVQDESAEQWMSEHMPQSAKDAARRAEIMHRLDEIDIEAVRPLRAITSGTGTDYDTNELHALESEAATLRTELATLPEQQPKQ